MQIIKELAFKTEGNSWNEKLIHQVVVSHMANQRIDKASKKSRSDVRGGGKKPWKQKGTGRARAGTIRSPLWRSGGVTFTGKRNYSQKINKKMGQIAFKNVLFRLFDLGMISFIEGFEFNKISTKEAVISVRSITEKNRVLIIDSTVSTEKDLSFRNLRWVDLIPVDKVGIMDLLRYDKVIITSGSHDVLVKKYSN
jgi:large subunit ribosomal protein L4